MAEEAHADHRRLAGSKRMTTIATAARRFGHPVIDADGHFVELAPVLDDALIAHLTEVGGGALRDRYLAGHHSPFDTSTVLAGRDPSAVQADWRAMPSWWG